MRSNIRFTRFAFYVLSILLVTNILSYSYVNLANKYTFLVPNGWNLIEVQDRAIDIILAPQIQGYKENITVITLGSEFSKDLFVKRHSLGRVYN